MASKWLQHGSSHHPPSSLLITHTKKSNSHGPATITSPPINSPIAFHHYRYEFLYRSVYFRSTPAHSQCCRRTLAELPMARTTKPRPFPRRMALRLLSAAVCLSLAAAGSREKEQRERDSTDSLAAVVDREVDIVGVYSEWWRDVGRSATAARRAHSRRKSRPLCQLGACYLAGCGSSPNIAPMGHLCVNFISANACVCLYVYKSGPCKEGRMIECRVRSSVCRVLLLPLGSSPLGHS